MTEEQKPTSADLLAQLGALLEAERASAAAAQVEERRQLMVTLEEVLRNLQRPEPAKTPRSSAGRFLLGLLLGGAVGVGAVILLMPRSGAQNRQSLGVRMNAALAAARKAASAREQELWIDFRKRLAEDQQT